MWDRFREQRKSSCKSGCDRYTLPDCTTTNRWNSDRQQPESPDAFDSRASLCASLVALAPVLASSCVAERVAPFIPTRVDCPTSRHGRE